MQFYSPPLQPRGHNIRLTALTWDPELNAALYSNGNNVRKGFIGDYFGNITAGSTNYSSFVSTYDDGSNPTHRQQQVIATVSLP